MTQPNILAQKITDGGGLIAGPQGLGIFVGRQLETLAALRARL